MVKIQICSQHFQFQKPLMPLRQFLSEKHTLHLESLAVCRVINLDINSFFLSNLLFMFIGKMKKKFFFCFNQLTHSPYLSLILYFNFQMHTLYANTMALKISSMEQEKSILIVNGKILRRPRYNLKQISILHLISIDMICAA